MSYSSARIANYFIIKSDFYVTPMKIINLVYMAHGWCLALTYAPLIDEPIIACRYGPTILRLNDKVESYGNQLITELIQYEYGEDVLTSEHTRLLDKTWEEFGDYTGEQLSNLTHQKDTPWDKVWNQCGGDLGLYKINDALIKEYYREKRDD